MGRMKPGEEWIDATLNRPLASGIVKAVLKTPITPNTITLVGMHIGIAAGFFFHQPGYMALGGVLLIISMIFDCADGQLARARGGGSRSGRILDGLADYVVGICIHVGLALALIGVREEVGLSTGLIWLITVAVMLSTAVQCFLLDYYKTRGEEGSSVDELVATREDLAQARANGGTLTDRILLPLYIRYTLLQRTFAGSGRKWEEIPEAQPPAPPGLLKKLAFIGPSTHNLLIALAAFFGTALILPYFALVLIAGNLYLVWALGSSRR